MCHQSQNPETFWESFLKLIKAYMGCQKLHSTLFLSLGPALYTFGSSQHCRWLSASLKPKVPTKQTGHMYLMSLGQVMALGWEWIVSQIEGDMFGISRDRHRPSATERPEKAAGPGSIPSATCRMIGNPHYRMK